MYCNFCNFLLLTAYTFTVNLPKWRFSKLLPWLFRSIAGTLCTPPRCSFNVDCSCFFFPLSDSLRALHSLRSSTTVKSLNGLIPPFLFYLPAGPASTMRSRSASDSNGQRKLYVRSRYLLASPLQALQPAFPPLCSPLSNCCSGPSPWKNLTTSFTFTPLLVSTWWGRWSRHSYLVSTYASCSISLEPHLPRI